MAAKAIDYVLPIVNHRDKLWQRDFQKALFRAGVNQFSAGSRWRTWFTEKYIFRGIEENMPWIRKIHVLVARESQVPKWLDTDKVHVVYHRDIMPAKFLPTFNSQSFEMFLKNIPGLAEQFIYSNDDMFPLSPLKRTDFYKFGKPCLHHDKRVWTALDTGIYRHVCRQSLHLVAKDFGVDFGEYWLKDAHGLSPMLLSTHEKVWELHEEELMASPTPFRSRRNYNQYLFNYYQHLSGQYVDSTPPTKYVDSKKPVKDVCDMILHGDGVFILNDCGSGEEWSRYRDQVIKAFEERFPNKSKYEI